MPFAVSPRSVVVCPTQGNNLKIKAGSHISPSGFNSTSGILCDMILLNDIKYSDTANTLELGPGCRWNDIPIYFKKNGISNVNVVGATSCEGVGVAGFLLCGGYGNKANQYGLAMDNITSIDVVTLKGEMLTANASQNSDLFRALKVY